MSDQFKVALIRAVISSFVTGGSSFFGVLAAGADLRAALIGAGAVIFATLTSRFAAEGLIDTNAAKADNP